jgi:hypothetical protein
MTRRGLFLKQGNEEREKGKGKRRRDSGEELDSESIVHRALAKIERDAK